MTGKRLQRRRKKQGRALLISRLIRLGMLAVVLLVLSLTAFGIRACIRSFSSLSAPAQSVLQEGDGGLQTSEDPVLPVVQPVYGVVTVDPGHGGSDPGCGDTDAPEKDIVMPISMEVKRLLEQAGVTVVMTRQTDEGVSLDERAIIANEAGSDLFVSIHCNSFEEETVRGMDCYYHRAEPAKQLAQAILDEAAGLGIVTREVQKNNYQVLWDTDMTAVLVETGFLTNPEEYALLCSEAYQKNVARAIAGAVLDTLRGDPV